MPTTYQVEPFAQAWPEAQSLLGLHWREIARDRDLIELAPMVDAYQALDASGQLLIVTMRISGNLVGYHASFIKPHLHYARSLTAFTDIFFIHPDHRRGRNAFRLFQAVEAQLKARGVQRMFASCKLSLDLLPLFTALGWTEIERNFSKVL
jgi:GNAT superfamily N-acetyltransferase